LEAQDRDVITRDVLTMIFGTAVLATLAASIVYYRRLPPFGSSTYKWENDYTRRSFGALGAALGLKGFGDGFASASSGSQHLDTSDSFVSVSAEQDISLDGPANISDPTWPRAAHR